MLAILDRTATRIDVFGERDRATLPERSSMGHSDVSAETREVVVVVVDDVNARRVCRSSASSFSVIWNR